MTSMCGMKDSDCDDCDVCIVIDVKLSSPMCRPADQSLNDTTW